MKRILKYTKRALKYLAIAIAVWLLANVALYFVWHSPVPRPTAALQDPLDCMKPEKTRQTSLSSVFNEIWPGIENSPSFSHRQSCFTVKKTAHPDYEAICLPAKLLAEEIKATEEALPEEVIQDVRKRTLAVAEFGDLRGALWLSVIAIRKMTAAAQFDAAEKIIHLSVLWLEKLDCRANSQCAHALTVLGRFLYAQERRDEGQLLYRIALEMAPDQPYQIYVFDLLAAEEIRADRNLLAAMYLSQVGALREKEGQWSAAGENYQVAAFALDMHMRERLEFPSCLKNAVKVYRYHADQAYDKSIREEPLSNAFTSFLFRPVVRRAASGW